MDQNDLCGSIQEGLPALFECSPAPQDGVRVRTPLMYPDGGLVDIFVQESGDGFSLTDFGETLGWLRMQSANLRHSPKQGRMIEDVCQTLGVELDREQLVLRSKDASGFEEPILRLAQAAVRVSDLWFTLRAQRTEAVAEEVSDWLGEKRITYDRAVRQTGRSGQDWTIDYKTCTESQTSLVFLLSAGSRAAARRIAEHVLAGCVDLSHLQENQIISLFDDTEDTWQQKDFKLVEPYSKIAYWSRPDHFERILQAA